MNIMKKKCEMGSRHWRPLRDISLCHTGRKINPFYSIFIIFLSKALICSIVPFTLCYLALSEVSLSLNSVALLKGQIYNHQWLASHGVWCRLDIPLPFLRLRGTTLKIYGFAIISIHWSSVSAFSIRIKHDSESQQSWIKVVSRFFFSFLFWVE